MFFTYTNISVRYLFVSVNVYSFVKKVNKVIISFGLVIFNVSKELKLKDTDRKIVYRRIKKENTKFVLTSSVLDRETTTIVSGSFRKEVKRVVNNQLIRSSKKSESYLTVVRSLYKIEISLLYFRLSL